VVTSPLKDAVLVVKREETFIKNEISEPVANTLDASMDVKFGVVGSSEAKELTIVVDESRRSIVGKACPAHDHA
jgi:hypothetical protein